MKNSFDEIIDRRNSYSIKHNPLLFGKPDDVLPLWVADMDFLSPPCVIDALVSRAHHGIFGYSEPDAAYFKVIQEWFSKRFGWNVEREWLVAAPGVVNAINIAVRAYTSPGDGILIQQPVYPPFESTVYQTGRKLLINDLVNNNGRYTIDFDDFESKIKNAKLFILCSPHNPVGRVWTCDELTRMAELCLKYNVKIIADEIHQDFVYNENRHLAFAALYECYAKNCVTCTAPSKTFNLAGLLHANIFIQDEAMRDAFKKEYSNCGLSQPSLMGIDACKAAYEGGTKWLDDLIEYLKGNINLLKEFLQTKIPKIKFTEPEGTYLAWLDFTEFSLSAEELEEKITNKAKLWLSNGAQFGRGGAGFMRMNLASPRSVINTALNQLEKVFG